MPTSNLFYALIYSVKNLVVGKYRFYNSVFWALFFFIIIVIIKEFCCHLRNHKHHMFP